MRYYVNFNELEKKIDFLDQHYDVITDSIEHLELLKSKIIWEGIAYNTFIQKYNNYLNDLKSMQTTIAKYILYFSSYYNGYKKEYNDIKNKYSMLLQKGDL